MVETYHGLAGLYTDAKTTPCYASRRSGTNNTVTSSGAGRHMRIPFGLLFLLVSTSVDAAAYNIHLSDKDAVSIHKVAVVSLLGDTLHLDTIGLTVFGNSAVDVPIAEWGIDASVVSHTVERIGAAARYSAEPLNVPPSGIGWEKRFNGFEGISREGKRTMMELAQAQGADTVVAIVRETKSNNRLLRAGLGLVRHRLFGRERVNTVAACSVSIYRVPDLDILGQDHPDPFIVQPTSVAWPLTSTWDDVAPEDKKRIEESIRAFASKVVDGALQKLKLAENEGP